ncbi:MAG: hypothetical protein ACRDSI_08215 [Pseudonocardiaceae bacterium]
MATQRLAEELGAPLNVCLHESPADPATGQTDVLRRAGALRCHLPWLPPGTRRRPWSGLGRSSRRTPELRGLSVVHSCRP